MSPIAFGEVAGPPWDDKVTFIVGGGASLRGFDLRRLDGLGHIIGVNQAMFDALVDIGISMDFKFIANNHDRLRQFVEVRNLYLAIGDHWQSMLSPIPGATYMRVSNEEGLSLYTDTIRQGCTSGYSALNVAVLRHARRIVLLGFDYGAVDGRHHYHDAYPWHKPEEQNWPAWARRFDAAAIACKQLGVEVVNASPQSAITAFPKMSIEEALQWRRCSSMECTGSATTSTSAQSLGS